MENNSEHNDSKVVVSEQPTRNATSEGNSASEELSKNSNSEDNPTGEGNSARAGNPTDEGATCEDAANKGVVCEAAPTAKKKSSKGAIIAIIVALVVVLVGIGAYVVFQNNRIAQDAQNQANATDKNLPVNPVNIVDLKSQNPEIYAWISIPGTKVDNPIVQSGTDDNYYYRKNLQGEYDEKGTLYTQSMNATDFSDPVTVVYGHYATDDTMFATLHYFENKDFFDKYSTIYVYTMHHILTYKVIAAYEYDDRHILNSYDFSDEATRTKYFESVLNPTSMVVNVRDGVELDANSKLIQLSTCMSAYVVSNTRYIVTGVLINDQQTQ